MLEDAEGINCQAANFCRTISALPQGTTFSFVADYPRLNFIAAGQMGVIDYGRETTDTDYVSKIQTFNRFMLDQFISEGNAFPHNPQLVPHPKQLTASGDFSAPAPAPITQLFGIDAKNIIICGNCGARREKEGLAHVVEMFYPKRVRGVPIYYSKETALDLGSHRRPPMKLHHQLILHLSSGMPSSAICPTERPARHANSWPLSILVELYPVRICHLF